MGNNFEARMEKPNNFPNIVEQKLPNVIKLSLCAFVSFIVLLFLIPQKNNAKDVEP